MNIKKNTIGVWRRGFVPRRKRLPRLNDKERAERTTTRHRRAWNWGACGRGSWNATRSRENRFRFYSKLTYRTFSSLAHVAERNSASGPVDDELVRLFSGWSKYAPLINSNGRSKRGRGTTGGEIWNVSFLSPPRHGLTTWRGRFPTRERERERESVECAIFHAD